MNNLNIDNTGELGICNACKDHCEPIDVEHEERNAYALRMREADIENEIDDMIAERKSRR